MSYRTIPLSRTQRDEAQRRAEQHRQPFLVIYEEGRQQLRALRYYYPHKQGDKRWGPPIFWVAYPRRRL